MKRCFSRIRNQPLRNHVMLIFCVFSVFAVLIQAVYFAQLYTNQRDKTTQESQELIGQANRKLDQLIGNIVQAGETLANNEAVQQFLLLQNAPSKATLPKRAYLRTALINYFGGIVEANTFLKDIAIMTDTREITSYNNVFDYATFSVLNRHSGLLSLQAGFFTPMARKMPDMTARDGFVYIAPVFNTWGAYSAKHQRLGLVFVWCNEGPLKELTQTPAVTPRSISIITDADGAILAMSPGELAGEMESLLPLIIREQGSAAGGVIRRREVMSEESYVLVKTNTQTGWHSVIITPVREIYAGAMHSLYLGIGVSLATISAALLLVLTVIRRMLRPLTATAQAIGRLHPDNSALPADGIRIRELGIIAAGINDMLSNLRALNAASLALQKKVYQAKLIQKETALLGLQSWVDPHFLNNTLECLRSIAVIRGIKEISVITTSMARIFQYSTGGAVFTPIREEASCISDYERIMTIRYNGRIRIKTHVQQELLPYTMLKMSLQPLVENAVYHGLFDSDEPLDILITGEMRKDHAAFTVEDNGMGMSPERLAQVRRMLQPDGEARSEKAGRKGAHIGLSNIHERIRLHYGQGWGLDVQSIQGGGTTVCMRIPLCPESNEGNACKEAWHENGC